METRYIYQSDAQTLALLPYLNYSLASVKFLQDGTNEKIRCREAKSPSTNDASKKRLEDAISKGKKTFFSNINDIYIEILQAQKKEVDVTTEVKHLEQYLNATITLHRLLLLIGGKKIQPNLAERPAGFTKKLHEQFESNIILDKIVEYAQEIPENPSEEELTNIAQIIFKVKVDEQEGEPLFTARDEAKDKEPLQNPMASGDSTRENLDDDELKRDIQSVLHGSNSLTLAMYIERWLSINQPRSRESYQRHIEAIHTRIEENLNLLMQHKAWLASIKNKEESKNTLAGNFLTDTFPVYFIVQSDCLSMHEGEGTNTRRSNKALQLGTEIKKIIVQQGKEPIVQKYLDAAHIGNVEIEGQKIEETEELNIHHSNQHHLSLLEASPVPEEKGLFSSLIQSYKNLSTPKKIAINLLIFGIVSASVFFTAGLVVAFAGFMSMASFIALATTTHVGGVNILAAYGIFGSFVAAGGPPVFQAIKNCGSSLTSPA